MSLDVEVSKQAGTRKRVAPTKVGGKGGKKSAMEMGQSAGEPQMSLALGVAVTGINAEMLHPKPHHP